MKERKVTLSYIGLGSMVLALSAALLTLLSGCDNGAPTPGPTPTIAIPTVVVPTPVKLSFWNPTTSTQIGVYTITAHLGTDYQGDNKCRPDHNGIDIAAPLGSEVRAIEGGTVIKAGEEGSAGNMVKIQHAEGYTSAYFHLSRYVVKEGDKVTRGQVIGHVGNTGCGSCGYHLHLKMQCNGTVINPLGYIPGGYYDACDSYWGERLPCSKSRGVPPLGGGGGLESMPLWMWEGGAFSGPTLVLTRTDQLHPSPLWKWATEGSMEDLLPLAAAQSVTYTIVLTDLMPIDVFTDTVRVVGEPENVVGWSNALEALSADYVASGTDEVIAGVTIYRTVGSVYAHDYPVCTRFKNGHLVYATPITVAHAVSATSPVYFWGTRTDVDAVTQEDASWFVAYVSEDEGNFLIDSQWMSDQYPITDTGYILTFQVRGEEPMAIAALIDDILHNLASRGSLAYRNDKMPAVPRVFVTDASYGYGQARMTIFNTSSQTKTVGFTAITWSAPYPESERTDYFTHSVPPGLSTVTLPLPGRLNGVIYMGDGEGFVDKVYVADGAWWAFGDGTSQAVIQSANCNNYAGDSSALLIAGCARLSGNVAIPNGYVGMARDLATFGQSIDLSNYFAVRFNMRGDGKPYMVKLETWAPNDGKYHYGRVITPTNSWQEIIIPFSEFKPLWNAPDFEPAAVKTISWVSIGGPHSSVDLEVDQVAFIAYSRSVYLPFVIGASGNYNPCVYCTSHGRGNTEVIMLSSVCQAQKIRIDMKKRGTIWGYSLWEVEIYGPDTGSTNLAIGGQAEASSQEDSPYCQCTAGMAIDGDINTRWSSDFSDPQWLEITLSKPQTVNQIVLAWETAYGKEYCVTVIPPR